MTKRMLIPAALACLILIGRGLTTARDNTSDKEPPAMATNTSEQICIPPLDRQVPDHLAVAVFGLG